MRVLTFAMTVLLVSLMLAANAFGSSEGIPLPDSEYVLSFTNTSTDDTFGVNLYLKTGPEETYYGSMWWTILPGMSVPVSLDLTSVENLDDIREIGFGLEAGIGNEFGQADHMRVLVHDPRENQALAGSFSLPPDEFLMSLYRTYVKPTKDWADLLGKIHIPGNSVEYDVDIYGTDFVEMGIGLRFGHGKPSKGNLIAGQHIVVGDVNVTVSSDLKYLYVTYTTTDGWWMGATHLHVATSLEDIPQKNGNPRPGNFDYQTVHDPLVTEYTYTIPIPPDWEVGMELYIAAHAVVNLFDEEGNCIQQETAWREGYDFPGKDWSTYFIYTGEEIEPIEPTPSDASDAAPTTDPARSPKGRARGWSKR